MHAYTRVRNSVYHKLMKRSGAEIKGVLKESEPMKKHTSWRAGGLARQYFQPQDVDDLCLFLQGLAKDEPLLWLGLGSNLLVRDGGFDGTVISTANLLNKIEQVEPYVLKVGAGVPCPKVARYSASQSMAGAEFFAGIPGTMGGALAMNAGAFGSETWEIVSKVETVNRQGQRQYRDKKDFEIGYRSINRSVDIENDEWFLQAELQLSDDRKGTAKQLIKSFINKRTETQPMGLPSCGSVFRNPVNDHAARLIEDCGLKGETIGGACVSKKHANFIINLGNATATDIELLISRIQSVVKEKHGVDLVPEVKVVGEE